jgi:hypothetical protein
MNIRRLDKSQCHSTSAFEAPFATLLPPRTDELLLQACVCNGWEASNAWSDFVRLSRGAKPFFENNKYGLKGLLPFVESRLEANGIDAGKTFHTYARVALVREELRCRIVSDILGEMLLGFSGVGIRPCLLKGVAMAATVYPQPSMRHIHAIDLLVEPEQWREANEVLPNLRFSADPPGPDAAHHVNYKHRSGLALGMHSRAFFLPYFEMPSAALEDRARPIDMGPCQAKVFAPEDNLVHVCGHAMYARTRANLRWACDAAFLIQKNPDLDWALVIDTAERAGTLPALSVQIHWLARTLCKVPTSSLLEMRQRAATCVAVSQEAIYAALLHTTESRSRTFRAFTGSPQMQAGFLRFSVLPSLQYMQWKHNTTSPLRLALCYAERPRRFASRAVHMGALT